jgi:hypothetical protein
MDYRGRGERNGIRDGSKPRKWETGLCSIATTGRVLVYVVARVDGRAQDHIAAIRDTIHSVDPQVPVFSVKTMEQQLEDLYVRPKVHRTAIWMLTAFGGLLAVIGIYGIVSYAVVQRTCEI